MTCEDCLHFIVCDALENNGIKKVHPIQCGCFEDKEKVKSALEKQIPKRVKEYRLGSFCCLSCGAIVHPTAAYCEYCGQALEWGDTE